MSKHDHHHDHGHNHNHHHYHDHQSNRFGLTIAFTITIGIVLLEIWGGLLSNSLALLSDSAHMSSDAISLGVSLIAILLSKKASEKIGGYSRLELGATFFNAITLLVIPVWILWEAYGRFIQSENVHGSEMMMIAIIGLIANLLSAWVLVKTSDVKGNLNVRSAYLHVLVDAWGSAGVILSGICIQLFSWQWVDPLISSLMALMIAKGGWGVLSNLIHHYKHHKRNQNSAG